MSSAPESQLLAFGGGPLAGDRWVRVLYMDESGVGNIRSDPFVVVAGVIIHADTQWGELARGLDQLLSDATPAGTKKPRFLHAKDIFHGSGEFPRETWSLKRRNALLYATGSLVHEFQLPVVWMGIDRKKWARDFPDDPPEHHLRDAYTSAAVGCFMQAEKYMRQQDNAAEVCSVVMEQNHELQKRIPEMVAFLRDPADETKNLLPGWESVMPLSKIIDTPACQPKTASSILQLADYCAFSLKRRLQDSAGSKRLTAAFSPQMVRYVGLSKGAKDFWNPVHMPSEWPFPTVYDGQRGRFVRVDGKGDDD